MLQSLLLIQTETKCQIYKLILFEILSTAFIIPRRVKMSRPSILVICKIVYPQILSGFPQCFGWGGLRLAPCWDRMSSPETDCLSRGFPQNSRLLCGFLREKRKCKPQLPLTQGNVNKTIIKNKNLNGYSISRLINQTECLDGRQTDSHHEEQIYGVMCRYSVFICNCINSFKVFACLQPVRLYLI